MKKIIPMILAFALIISGTSSVIADRAYVGETVVKDNLLFINGNSIPAAQLPNEYVYLPVETLEYYGFDVLYNEDNGHKEYTVNRNESTYLVPEFTYNADRYKNFTKVYTTDAKVYLDSQVPANVFELENGVVLIQSDELAKYGVYNWNVNSHTITIDFKATGFMPVAQPFHNVLGLNNIDDIASATIVRNDGKCADIEQDDLKNWLNVYWNFAPYDRVISPYNQNKYREYYIKLWTSDKTKSFIVYPDGGVIVGNYGVPVNSHGVTKANYIWYMPYIGNGRNALYTADTKLVQIYLNEKSQLFTNKLRGITADDAEIIPENNMLETFGASEWAIAEIQKAAACNLLPYELTDKYQSNITRQEFCKLIYRLIATEFSPDSDSRMGEWSAIDKIIYERNLADKVNSVFFSDCDDDKIKFLYAAGIIFGNGDGTFAPEQTITREQAATILHRTAVFLGNKTIPPLKNSVYYDDEQNISDWAINAVKIMKDMRIMNGVTETSFDSKGNYTTEQAIATVLRLYECN